MRNDRCNGGRGTSDLEVLADLSTVFVLIATEHISSTMCHA